MFESNRNPDADLRMIAEALASDEKAMDALIDRMRCVPAMVAALNAKLGRPLDTSELHDVSQEALMLIWQRLPSFEGRSTFETWVHRFCSFVLLNAARKRRRARTREVLDVEPADGSRPTSESRWAEYDDVHCALERLSDEESRCVRLKHFDDLTFDEIGARLAISSNTAKTQYYRGLRRLRELLAHREGDPSS